MDLSLRYPVIVQVITRHGRDVFYGYVPDFEIETFEAVDPGNLSQEYMFHMKLRRMIGEALAVHRIEKKEVPLIRSAAALIYNEDNVNCSEDMRTYTTSDKISTSAAAKILGIHSDTIRNLFDTGVLKGSLSQGGQRLILMSSVQEEKKRMKQRAEMRQLELRAKKKRRRQRGGSRSPRVTKKSEQSTLEQFETSSRSNEHSLEDPV